MSKYITVCKKEVKCEMARTTEVGNLKVLSDINEKLEEFDSSFGILSNDGVGSSNQITNASSTIQEECGVQIERQNIVEDQLMSYASDEFEDYQTDDSEMYSHIGNSPCSPSPRRKQLREEIRQDMFLRIMSMPSLRLGKQHIFADIVKKLSPSEVPLNDSLSDEEFPDELMDMDSDELSSSDWKFFKDEIEDEREETARYIQNARTLSSIMADRYMNML